MSLEDVPHGLRLSRQAGWNQTEDDWRRLLAVQPDGGLVAECDGLAVGTLTCARYGPVAWIAMMLVDEAWRGRGIGRALMTHVLARLDGDGVPTARLDATPLGQPLYESLGFVPEYTIARHEGRPAAEAAPGPAAQPPDAARLAGILDLDRDATGIDRSRLLRSLAESEPDAIRCREGGFIMTRPGFHKHYVGPCIAGAEAGPALLADAFARLAGRPVFVDVPTGHAGALAAARGAGLTVQRHLLRMRRGAPVDERAGSIWAIAGPDLG